MAITEYLFYTKGRTMTECSDYSNNNILCSRYKKKKI